MMTFRMRTCANRPSAQRPYTVAAARPSCSAPCRDAPEVDRLAASAPKFLGRVTFRRERSVLGEPTSALTRQAASKDETMTNDDSVDTIKALYAAFGARDPKAIFALLSPEIEWSVPGKAPRSGEGRDLERVQRFFQTFGTIATLKTFEPRRFFADGDQVVVLGYEEGASNATGRSRQAHLTYRFTVAGSRITAHREYIDTWRSLTPAAPEAVDRMRRPQTLTSRQRRDVRSPSLRTCASRRRDGGVRARRRSARRPGTGASTRRTTSWLSAEGWRRASRRRRRRRSCRSAPSLWERTRWWAA
jgi:ketosteroid isomerase-like protein